MVDLLALIRAHPQAAKDMFTATIELPKRCKTFPRFPDGLRRSQTMAGRLHLILSMTTATALCIFRSLAEKDAVLVSKSDAGVPGADSRNGGISGDGAVIVFSSSSDTLIANDTNGVEDVFVYYVSIDATRRISINSNGDQADGASGDPIVSPSGSGVIFRSAATNLSVDHSPTKVILEDTNDETDAYHVNLKTMRMTRVSLNRKGDEFHDTSVPRGFSADGNYILFFHNGGGLYMTPTP